MKFVKKDRREGIERALSKGKPYGRPTAVTKETVLEVQSLLEQGLTTAEIMRKIGFSRNTYFRIKKGIYNHLLSK